MDPQEGGVVLDVADPKAENMAAASSSPDDDHGTTTSGKSRSQSDEETLKDSPSIEGDDDVVPVVGTGSSDQQRQSQSQSQQPQESNVKASCIAGYGLIYGAIFLLVATVLVVPLILSNGSPLEDNAAAAASSSTLPLASAKPTATSSLPAPHHEFSSNSPLTVQVMNKPPEKDPQNANNTPLNFSPTTGNPTTVAPTFDKSPTSSAPSSLAPVAVLVEEEQQQKPTSRPTATPSWKPATATGTGGVTSTPSQSPSFSPSNTPTKPPTTKPAPSSNPTTSPDFYNTPLFNYLVVLGTPEEVLSDPTTPQGQAFVWLMQPQVEQISVFRVSQRFALVALDFALHQAEEDDDDDDDNNDHKDDIILDEEEDHEDGEEEEAAGLLFAAPKDATNKERNETAADAVTSSKQWRSYDKDMCDWDGVTCDERKEVISIKWSGQGLRGKMIQEIILLPKLEKVDLAQNQITGNLDPFWELAHLKELYLFENRFTGIIPERPAPEKLERAYLGKNQLEGGFPVAFTTATGTGPKDLRYLILHHNRLNGTLPTRFRLRQLYYLDLSDNEFEGPIDGIDWPQMLPALRVLYMENNKLAGQLPLDFPQVGGGNVKQLFLQGNNFTGTFPSFGWSDYHLTNLNIAHNNFDEIRDMCGFGVFEGGEMVELRADCNVCTCETLCHTCANKTEESLLPAA